MEVHQFRVVEISVIHSRTHLLIHQASSSLNLWIVQFVTCDMLHRCFSNDVAVRQSEPVTHIATNSVRYSGPSSEFSIIVMDIRVW